MPQRTSDYRIADTTFRVSYGDITQVTAEALVSSDDINLSMYGGVSRALLEAGGPVLRQDALKHIPRKIGDAVVTSAGQLPARYVFHAITLDRDRSILPNESNIRAATLKCLQLADALDVHHIAFPALGTGSAKFPFQLAAEVMTRTIADYLSGDTGVELVTLTLFAREIVSESDLNLFYERVVGLASVATQSKKLNSLLVELQTIVEGMQQPGLLENVRGLQTQLTHAQSILAENSTTSDNLDQLQDRSGIAEVSRQVLAFSTQTQAALTGL